MVVSQVAGMSAVSVTRYLSAMLPVLMMSVWKVVVLFNWSTAPLSAITQSKEGPRR